MSLLKNLARSSAARKHSDILFSVIEETLGSIKIIKSPLQVKIHAGQIWKHQPNLLQTVGGGLPPHRSVFTAQQTVIVGILMVILFIGGSMVIYKGGGLSAETFILYFIAASVNLPHKQMTVATAIYNGLASEERIEKILKALLVITQPGASIPAQHIQQKASSSATCPFAYKRRQRLRSPQHQPQYSAWQNNGPVGQSGSGKNHAGRHDSSAFAIPTRARFLLMVQTSAMSGFRRQASHRWFRRKASCSTIRYSTTLPLVLKMWAWMPLLMPPK